MSVGFDISSISRVPFRISLGEDTIRLISTRAYRSISLVVRRCEKFWPTDIGQALVWMT